MDQFGAKLPLIFGPTIAAAGFAALSLPGIGGSYWTTFFPAVIILSIGMTITVAPLTTAVMGAVPSHEAGTASGVNNALSRTAALLAVAVLGILIANAFNSSLDNQLAGLRLSPQARQDLEAQRSKLAGAEVPAGVSVEQRARIERAIDEAFLRGYRLVMLASAGMALAGALSAALLIEGKPAPERARYATEQSAATG